MKNSNSKVIAMLAIAAIPTLLLGASICLTGAMLWKLAFAVAIVVLLIGAYKHERIGIPVPIKALFSALGTMLIITLSLVQSVDTPIVYFALAYLLVVLALLAICAVRGGDNKLVQIMLFVTSAALGLWSVLCCYDGLELITKLPDWTEKASEIVTDASVYLFIAAVGILAVIIWRGASTTEDPCALWCLRLLAVTFFCFSPALLRL